jgi:hypothetical protein
MRLHAWACLKQLDLSGNRFVLRPLSKICMPVLEDLNLANTNLS